MACGLVLCAIVNVGGLGFSSILDICRSEVVFNGLFRAGVGPRLLPLPNWFPRRGAARTRRRLLEYLSRITLAAGSSRSSARQRDIGRRTLAKRQLYRSACVAVILRVIVLVWEKVRRAKVFHSTERTCGRKSRTGRRERKPRQKRRKNMSAWQIFCTYVLRNKNARYISLVDVFVYMVRLA